MLMSSLRISITKYHIGISKYLELENADENCVNSQWCDSLIHRCINMMAILQKCNNSTCDVSGSFPPFIVSVFLHFLNSYIKFNVKYLKTQTQVTTNLLFNNRKTTIFLDFILILNIIRQCKCY